MNDFLIWFGEIMPHIFEDTINNGATWIVLITGVMFPVSLIIISIIKPEEKYIPKKNVKRDSDEYVIYDVVENFGLNPQGNLLYEGALPTGQPIANRQDNLIYEGALPTGQPMYNIQDNLIYEGALPTGQPIANVHDGLLYEGALPTGQPIANVHDGLLYDGALPTGQPTANIL